MFDILQIVSAPPGWFAQFEQENELGESDFFYTEIAVFALMCDENGVKFIGSFSGGATLECDQENVNFNEIMYLPNGIPDG